MAALRAYVNRVRAHGWPFLVTVLAFVLALVALTQPLWVFEQRAGGGDLDRTTYTWTTLVEEQWENGAWVGTTWTPYSAPNFPDFRMRDAAQTSYSIGAAYAALLGLLAFLQYRVRSKKASTAAIMVLNLVALGVGALTIAYPAATVPPAATVEVSSSATTWSGTAPGPGNTVLAWDGGPAWWLWIGATILMVVVFFVPLLLKGSWSRASPAQ